MLIPDYLVGINSGTMKTFRKPFRTGCYLLIAMTLFQSCVVYRKTPTSLEEASKQQIRTKIIKTNGEISKYRYITYEDGQFYGVRKKSGELVKTPLSEQEIKKVLTNNKSASTWVTVGVIAYAILGVIAVIKGAATGFAMPSF